MFDAMMRSRSTVRLYAERPDAVSAGKCIFWRLKYDLHGQSNATFRFSYP